MSSIATLARPMISHAAHARRPFSAALQRAQGRILERFSAVSRLRK